MLTLAFNLQQVEAEPGTIYIKADGSVDPTTANITSVNNVTYTFTSNIYDEVVVERDNVTLDGAGYTLQGTGGVNEVGIRLTGRNNVTIQNMTIMGFGSSAIYLSQSSNNILQLNNITKNLGWSIELSYSNSNTVRENNVIDNESGIRLYYSNNNTLYGNNIRNFNIVSPSDGIWTYYSSYNTFKENNLTDNINGVSIGSGSYITISGNNIMDNHVGIYLGWSCNDTIFGNNIVNNKHYGVWIGAFSWLCYNFHHNNLVNNTQQVFFYQSSKTHIWDDGYPSGGNFWSDYTGADVKSGPNQDQPSSDGIGDTAYVVDANNTDHYPLMYPWGTPPPPSYTLTVYSSPTGVTFTVNGVSRTTSWLGTYIEGTSVSLVMPETHDGYKWSHWLEDGDTNRTKTVTMDTNITLTGVFTPVPPIATVDIDPDTLNLKSKGKWITCYIELPKGYDVSDIDRTTILLNDTIPVDPFWIDKPLESVVGDYDDDGIPDLMFKFSRTEVSEYIHYVKGITYGDVTLTITGELYDGSLFEGSDVIRIKMPSEVNSDDDEYVDIYDIAIPEFPSFLILPLFMIATLLAVIGYRRKHTM